MKILTRLRQIERAAHLRALARPQAFRLTDEGAIAWELILTGEPDGPELAAARYHDWLTTRALRFTPYHGDDNDENSADADHTKP